MVAAPEGSGGGGDGRLRLLTPPWLSPPIRPDAHDDDSPTVAPSSLSWPVPRQEPLLRVLLPPSFLEASFLFVLLLLVVLALVR